MFEHFRLCVPLNIIFLDQRVFVLCEQTLQSCPPPAIPQKLRRPNRRSPEETQGQRHLADVLATVCLVFWQILERGGVTVLKDALGY